MQLILIGNLSSGKHAVIYLIAVSSGAWLDAADQYGRTALYFAAKCGHIGIVRRLLSAGADANKTDTKGLTPLAGLIQPGPLHLRPSEEDMLMTKDIVFLIAIIGGFGECMAKAVSIKSAAAGALLCS